MSYLKLIEIQKHIFQLQKHLPHLNAIVILTRKCIPKVEPPGSSDGLDGPPKHIENGEANSDQAHYDGQ